MTDLTPGGASFPLRPIEFEILVTLAAGESHGYAIIQAIEARTDGAEQTETATLYRALKRLVDAGLVRPATRRRTGPDDERRRYYAITAPGARAATREARRLERLVRAARAARLLPEPA